MGENMREHMTRLRGLSRGVSRVIALATAVLCAGLLARAVHTSCIIAAHGVTPGSAEDLTAGAAVIGTVGDFARMAADVLSVPSMLAVAALAAVALGSLLVVVRSQSDRAGATFFALAVFAALTLSRTEARAMLDDGGHTAWHLAARIGLAIGVCVLAWRWIEDVALASSLLPSDDPHAVDAAADREAEHIATHGPLSTDAASRRLRQALRAESKEDAEPALHGRGSPVPRVMPAPQGALGAAD